MSDELVAIQVFESDIEAGTARSLLESEGIAAFVWSGGFSGWRPAVEMSQGIALLVPKDAAEAARAILGLSASEEE